MPEHCDYCSNKTKWGAECTRTYFETVALLNPDVSDDILLGLEQGLRKTGVRQGKRTGQQSRPKTEEQKERIRSLAREGYTAGEIEEITGFRNNGVSEVT